ncbi:T6SS immunity protein Tli4 family protein [Cupriavidus basilensis]
MTNNPLLADPRPWCIGRLLVDRPARSGLSYERYEYWGDKIDIAKDVSLGTFQHSVDTRESELRAKRRTTSVSSYKEMLAKGLKSMIVETDIPWLEQAVSPTSNSRLLIFKDLGRVDYSFTAEGYVLAGSTMLTMKSRVNSSEVQKFTQLTTDVHQNITYRDDWTVPTERGFCIPGALIGGPSRNSELAEQTIVLHPGRASAFVIKMRDAVDVDQQSSLLKTLPDLRQKLRAQGSVQILREGKRQIAGMEAEEVLFSIREGGSQLYRFHLLAPGNPDSVAQPHTEIQLRLGSALTEADKDRGVKPEAVSSLVDEAGAIQAWDALLDSMRLRPGAM